MVGSCSTVFASRIRPVGNEYKTGGAIPRAAAPTANRPRPTKNVLRFVDTIPPYLPRQPAPVPLPPRDHRVQTPHRQHGNHFDADTRCEQGQHFHRLPIRVSHNLLVPPSLRTVSTPRLGPMAFPLPDRTDADRTGCRPLPASQ